MNEQHTDEFWKSLYYIELRDGTKRPRYKWGGYDQDFDEAEHVHSWDGLQPNQRYGYIAHRDYRLGVLDLDLYKDAAPDVDDVTFHEESMLIQTGSGGFHIPFLIPDDEVDIQLKPFVSDWVDLKGDVNHGHAVFPFNNEYEIVKDGTVGIFIPEAGEHHEIAKVNGSSMLKTTSRRNETFSGDCPYQEVYNVLDEDVYEISERHEHPVHGSSTGTNFMVDENRKTWRCWRHNTTGNLLHLVGMQLGHLDCGEWDDKRYSELKQIYAQIKKEAIDLGIDVREREDYRIMAIPEDHQLA